MSDAPSAAPVIRKKSRICVSDCGRTLRRPLRGSLHGIADYAIFAGNANSELLQE
ncbi:MULTISPECIES: hypothetical protein [Paracoccus]|uniref:hypothetical protein n=1 Tax=Paracoccus TaxID=265 RepID=UPI00146B6C15|nr:MULTISPECIES: hypothetical protein [Paracoccus]